MPGGPKPFLDPTLLALIASLFWRGTSARDSKTGALLGELVDSGGKVHFLFLESGAYVNDVQWAIDRTLPARRQPFLLTQATYEALREKPELAIDFDGVHAIATAT